MKTTKDQHLKLFVENFMRIAVKYLGCRNDCPEMRKHAENEARDCFPHFFTKGSV